MVDIDQLFLEHTIIVFGISMVGHCSYTYIHTSYLLLCHININPMVMISIKMTTELTTPAMIGIGGPADEKFCSTDSGRYKIIY